MTASNLLCTHYYYKKSQLHGSFSHSWSHISDPNLTQTQTQTQTQTRPKRLSTRVHYTEYKEATDEHNTSAMLTHGANPIILLCYPKLKSSL